MTGYAHDGPGRTFQLQVELGGLCAFLAPCIFMQGAARFLDGYWTRRRRREAALNCDLKRHDGDFFAVKEDVKFK